MRRALLALAFAAGAAHARAASGNDASSALPTFETGGFVDGLAVVPLEKSPRQQPSVVADLWVKSTVRDWLRGFVDLRAAVGGPFEGGHAGVFNFRQAFQDLSPSLSFREAYADLSFDDFDARIGLQKFAWGKLDGVPPSDAINPRSYHDPFVEDYEDTKIGVPALALSYAPGDLLNGAISNFSSTLVYVPLAVPSLFPLLDERWFPPTSDFQEVTFEPPPDSPVSGRITIPVAYRTVNDAPAKTLDNGGLGLRVSLTWLASDFELYSYVGPATAPNARLVATIRGTPGPTIPTDVRADLRLKQTTSRLGMVGAAWSRSFGEATVRAEATFFRDQLYLRSGKELFAELTGSLTTQDLVRLIDELETTGAADVPIPNLVVKRDAAEWGVAADYLLGSTLFLLQLNQIALMEDAPDLLISDPTTRLTARVSRTFLGDTLQVEVQGTYSIDNVSWVFFPRVEYSPLDGVRLRFGYLSLGGPENSLLGQFKENDELVFQARYAF